MPLNHSLVGVPGEPQERSWTSADALLYAIGVGAGLGDPLRELEFTTENTAGVQQRVLPTLGILLAQARASGSLGDFDRAMLVHAEQSIELHKELPVEGRLRTESVVTGIYDKGSGALVETENHAVDAASGEPIVTTRASTFIRGEGGFGGERGTSEPWELPDRAPDHKVTQQTRPEQALLYQLIQIFLLQHLVLNHPHQQLLHRAAAKAVDDVLDGARREMPLRLSGLVEKGSAFHLVCEKTLLLQAPQYRADGRILERAHGDQGCAAGVRRGWAPRPDEFHEELLEFAKRTGPSFGCVKHRSVTMCNI